MCGRFVCDLPPGILSEHFSVTVPSDIPRSFNIAPSSRILAVRCLETGKELALLRWGLVPSWAKDSTHDAHLINARSETAHEKPSFRKAFRYRRCIIPANGFFEWKGEGKTRQPFYIRMKENQIMGLAGLWEHWTSHESESLETCTILTAPSNSLIRTIHDRMPVILLSSGLTGIVPIPGSLCHSAHRFLQSCWRCIKSLPWSIIPVTTLSSVLSVYIEINRYVGVRS